MQEIKALVVDFRTLMGQGREGRRKLTHNVIDEAVAWRLHRMLLGKFAGLSVHDCDTERRCLEGKTFDKLLQRGGETTASAPVGTSLTYQTSQSLGVVALSPAPQRS